MRSEASCTTTSRPPCASVIAAARPFGPLPTTTALRAGNEVAKERDHLWVDPVLDRRLAILDLCAGTHQHVSCFPTELDGNHGVVGAVDDGDRRERRLEVELEPLDT